MDSPQGITGASGPHTVDPNDFALKYYYSNPSIPAFIVLKNQDGGWKCVRVADDNLYRQYHNGGIRQQIGGKIQPYFLNERVVWEPEQIAVVKAEIERLEKREGLKCALADLNDIG